MRITWGRLRPGTWGAYAARFEEVHRDLPLRGLNTRYLVQDTAQKDSCFSISIWETMDDLVSYERWQERDTVTREFQEFFTGDVYVQRCEIKVAHHYDASHATRAE